MTADQRCKAYRLAPGCDSADDLARALGVQPADVSRIWRIANEPFRDLLCGHRMTVAAEELVVPYRTMQSWCCGERECPIYVRIYVADYFGFGIDNSD